MESNEDIYDIGIPTCGNRCSTVNLLEQDLLEKDTKIVKLESILKKKKEFEKEIEKFILFINDSLIQLQPICNFLRNKAELFPKIEKIYISKFENENLDSIFDIRFIIYEENFEIDEEIAKICYELMKIFSNPNFDFMIFSKEEYSEEIEIESGFQLIYPEV